MYRILHIVYHKVHNIYCILHIRNSNYDNDRSIPDIRDGFKPSIRKIMYSCFKRNLKKKTKIPVVAIGGINDKNYKKLISKGANYIAISTYIWNNPVLKPYEAIRKFR